MKALKLQARSNRSTKADRTLVFRYFVEEHMSQCQIARRLACSEEAVRRQKVKLIDAGIIREIGNSGKFERGENAKFFEAVEPVLTTSVEQEISNGSPLNINADDRYGGTVEGVPLPSGARDLPADVPIIEPHIKDGGMIFPVQTVGRLLTYSVKENDAWVERPLFRESIKGKNNLWQYDTDISLPGERWTAGLQLQVFTPAKKPKHAHLRIFPPRARVTLDEALAGVSLPSQFFEREVYAILDHLEKFAGYRFARQDGRRVGRRDGKVEYAWRLPEEIKRLVPPNFQGFVGTDMHVDESPGKGKSEIESETLARLEAMIRAKEHFQEVNGRMDGLQEAMRAKEHEIDLLRLSVLDKQAEIWRAMDDISEIQRRSLDAQGIEARTRATVRSAPQDPAIAAMDEEQAAPQRGRDTDPGVMFG